MGSQGRDGGARCHPCHRSARAAGPGGRDPQEGDGFAQASSEGHRPPAQLYLALQLFSMGQAARAAAGTAGGVAEGSWHPLPGHGQGTALGATRLRSHCVHGLLPSSPTSSRGDAPGRATLPGGCPSWGGTQPRCPQGGQVPPGCWEGTTLCHDGVTFPMRRRRKGLEASLHDGKEKPRPTASAHGRHHCPCTEWLPRCHGRSVGPARAPGGTDSPLSLPLLALRHPGALPSPRGSPAVPGLGAAVPKPGAAKAAPPSPSPLSQPHRNSAPGPGRPPAPTGAETAAPHPAPPARAAPARAQPRGAGSYSQPLCKSISASRR